MNEALGAFAALRRRRRAKRPVEEPERCDLCAQQVPADHRHLFDPQERQLVCACGPCAILFPWQAKARYKEVPRETRRLAEYALSDADWDALMIPINIAFFVRSAGRVTAFYPSPAGAMASSLDVSDLPLVPLLDDVEALVINRLGEPQYWVLPIDHCYRLVGIIRSKWRGLSGGDEVWDAVGRFFAELRDA
jgi:hypothetical protein